VIGLVGFLAGYVAGVAGYLTWTAVAGRRRCPHPWTLHFSRARVWLECPVCGETSPGWDLTIDNLHPAPRPHSRGGLWPTVQ
jgi:hypothetical protein